MVYDGMASFIHSGYFYSASSKSTTTLRRSQYSTDTMSEFHAAAPQATASERLAQDPNVAARAEFEPAALRTKGDESTNEPPRPIHIRRGIWCDMVYGMILLKP